MTFDEWWEYTTQHRFYKGLPQPKTMAEAAWNAATCIAAAQEREACAMIAREGCLVPPDGGSPTDDEIGLCDHIEAMIRARSA